MKTLKGLCDQFGVEYENPGNITLKTIDIHFLSVDGNEIEIDSNIFDLVNSYKQKNAKITNALLNFLTKEKISSFRKDDLNISIQKGYLLEKNKFKFDSKEGKIISSFLDEIKKNDKMIRKPFSALEFSISR